MMLCKPDFEELFPELFRPSRPTVEAKSTGAPSPACIARWEDDGGRPGGQLHRSEAPVIRPASYGHRTSDPMRTSVALATMPAAAAYGAA